MNLLRAASRRPLLRAVLLLALAVRAFMPAGVMAASADDGALTLQLCTAAGIESVTLPGTPPPADRHIDGACLGALANGSPLVPPTAALPAFAAAGVVLPARASAWRAVPAIQRSQSPRGPPAPELSR
ncbi:MAG: hypothetical protein RIS35_2007 [Pseudomonadota bacterium]